MSKILSKYYTNGVVKDFDREKRIVSGYYASWGRDTSADPNSDLWVDSDGDVFSPNAFDTTIRQLGPKGANRVWHFGNHKISQGINKPFELLADNFGLFFRTKFPVNYISDYWYSLYDAGAITEHSVTFETLSESKQSFNGFNYNYIEEVRLWEGSSVMWGANSNTPTKEVKSEDLALQMKILDNILHEGYFQDETYEMIEKTLQDIKAIYKGSGDNKPIDPAPAKTNGIDVNALILQFTQKTTNNF